VSWLTKNILKPANGHSHSSAPVAASRPSLPADDLAGHSEPAHFSDDLLALAAYLCGTPVAIFTSGGETFCWRQGETELSPFALAREVSFCADVATLSEGLLVVPDTKADRYFRDHPCVSGEPGIRFQASAPLITADGRNLGALYVLDYKPRVLGTEQRAALARLSRQVANQLALREQTKQLTRTTESEQRFRTLVETAPGGFVLMDVLGTALYATTNVTRLMGYEMNEVIGRDLFTLIHPEDRSFPFSVFTEVVATPGAKGTSEFRVLHKDGTWKWMEAIAQNFLEEPSIQAIACSLWDISARKAAEAALRESEARFRRIMDSNMVGIFFWNADGRITDANDRFLSMVGYTRDDLNAGLVNWSAMTPPEYHEADRGRLEELANTGACAPLEKEFIRKDKTLVPVLLGAATLEGHKDRGACFAIDATDRKKAEQELTSERNLLRTLIDHIPDFIFVKDTQSHYLLNNKANVAALGLKSPEEAIGKTPADFFPPEIAQQFHEEDSVLLRTGQGVIDYERELTGPDGKTRNLLATKVPLRDATGKTIGLVGISRDITERLALEAQLRQSQKMECVGQLAGGVAHDFNNILTVIQGHAALILDEPLTPMLHASAQQIAEASDRAANLTRQLLAFSRRNVLQPKNLDLNEVVCQTAKMLERVLGEDIALEVRYASNLPPVHADRGMIEQVLLNLAVNSRDAMPKGGRLELSLKVFAIDRAGAARHPDARPGTFVGLVVRDSGCGIAKENLEHIFEPFFTTKDVGRGTGLGLATVYGILKQHNGWISVESEVGRGTTFEIFLPATERPVSPVPTSAQNVRGGSECILLVEDEEPLRELVRCVLETYGYTVVDAASGKRAFDVWKQNAERVDLLLTDIVMPDGVTGRDLADSLKQQKPNLRVLFSSGYSSDIIGKDFVLSDGINFLQKPYNPQTLAQTVRDCLDQ